MLQKHVKSLLPSVKLISHKLHFRNSVEISRSCFNSVKCLKTMKMSSGYSLHDSVLLFNKTYSKSYTDLHRINLTLTASIT